MTYSHALRSLRRTPGFTITVILSLMLGIASAASMFAIVYGVLLAPLPYPAADRLVSIELLPGSDAQAQHGMQQPPALLRTYQAQSQRLSDVGFYRFGNANMSIDSQDGGETAERISVAFVSASVIELLQVQPLLGRAFTAAEERAGGSDAVMLSEFLWRTRFAAAPDVLGKTLIVNDIRRQIVGVMPVRFAFPSAQTQLWLPIRAVSTASVDDFYYSALGRLAPGATAQQAQSELASILPRLADTYPTLKSGGSTTSWLAEVQPRPQVRALLEANTSRIARPLWLLAAATALVLIVAWANVANLLLMRADGRQLELAVRAALGAGRLRMATHFLGESLLLGAAAAMLAVLLSYAAVGALAAYGPLHIPRLRELSMGWETPLFIVIITSAGVLLCSALPALRLQRHGRAVQLREGSRSALATPGRARLLTGIAVLQIAIALVVCLGSALLLRTAHRLSNVHPGFEAGEVTSLWTLLPFAGYDEPAAVRFYAHLIAQVRELPTVVAAGVSMQVPLGKGGPLQQNFSVERDGRSLPLPVQMVSDGYFATLRVPLLAGRDFPPLEQAQAQAQAAHIIINQRAAAELYGDPSGATALGKRLRLAASNLDYTIIGVVADVRDQDLASAPRATVYRPRLDSRDPSVEPVASRGMVLLVRSSGPADALLPAIRRIVHALDPGVPLFDTESVSAVLDASTAQLSLALTLLGFAALVSLLLGMIGLYGVMAYMVALRSREFGVRIALGANPGRIAGWVTTRGLLLTGAGIAAGLALYAPAAPLLQGFLYGVTATDPLTLLGTTLLLVCIAALASWLPARRAASIDAAQALRAQ